jgi:hypothetical protein
MSNDDKEWLISDERLATEADRLDRWGASDGDGKGPLIQAALTERLLVEVAELKTIFGRIADALEEANDIEKARGQISKPTTLKSLGKGKG